MIFNIKFFKNPYKRMAKQIKCFLTPAYYCVKVPKFSEIVSKTLHRYWYRYHLYNMICSTVHRHSFIMYRKPTSNYIPVKRFK
jgi:hypothetical protein